MVSNLIPQMTQHRGSKLAPYPLPGSSGARANHASLSVILGSQPTLALETVSYCP